MIAPYSIAVILAGGRSSRMQQDKALLPFGGYDSLAEFQYRRLSKIFSKVYISSKNNKFDFDVHVLEDKYKGSSPLVALVSMFETLEELEEVFVLSVDAPFVSHKSIAKLYESTSSFDVLVAESSSGLEPLCAVYRRSCLKEAKKALELNKHRLQSLLEQLKIKRVKIDDDECMNLNYPSEYEIAQRRWDS